jgi:ribosomal protein S18 acetylase RimI-like enzyme
MNVADYDPTQARQIVEMWRASFEHGVGIRDPHPIEDQIGFFLEEVVPNSRVRVALDGSTVIGFMASTPESIEHLYVRVEYMGQGVGSRLLALAKTESQGSLCLHTFTQNKNARRFYELHGFTEVERESENMWKLEAIKYQWVRSEGAP